MKKRGIFPWTRTYYVSLYKILKNNLEIDFLHSFGFWGNTKFFSLKINFGEDVKFYKDILLSKASIKWWQYFAVGIEKHDWYFGASKKIKYLVYFLIFEVWFSSLRNYDISTNKKNLTLGKISRRHTMNDNSVFSKSNEEQCSQNLTIFT